MTLHAALPILLPMLAGALSLIFWNSHGAQRLLAVLGTGAMLIAAVLLLREVSASGIVVLQAGNWPAPFGIVLVADMLGAILTMMTAFIGLMVALFSRPTVGAGLEHAGYYPLMHLLLAGVAGAFLTGDLFNLYVWFEVLLLASFALLAMGGERAQMAGALKYVVLNLVSSALFLTAIGLLYGIVGTLNMADIAVRVQGVDAPGRITAIATLFMVAFSIKAAAFPLFFWLPASYHTAPVAVSALFAGLLTKVGVYALYRSFTLLFTQDVAFTHEVIRWVAAATLLVGVTGACVQSDFRRVLAFCHIGQIGYLFLGLAVLTPLSLVGGVFYIIHHIIVIAGLFFVAGVVYVLRGTHRIDALGGLWRTHIMLGAAFFVLALSLAGVPPLSGFWAKFIIIKALVVAEDWVMVGVGLLGGLLTLYAVMRLFMLSFWRDPPEGASAASPAAAPAVPRTLMAVVLLLAATSVLIGLFAQPVWTLAEAASTQLLTPSVYIDAVLGEGHTR